MVLVAPLFALVLDRAPPRGRRLGLAAVPLALVLAWVAAGRVAAWQSETTLYEAELAAEPDNSFAAKELGRLRVGEGATDEGLALWARALRNPPASPFVMDVQRERLDFAQATLALGRPAEAVWALEDFLAAEAAAGRPIDPSVRQLHARAVQEAG
jgi:predicted Zn-dependent protease